MNSITNQSTNQSGQAMTNFVNNNNIQNRLQNNVQNRNSDTDAILGDNDDECIGGNSMPYGNLDYNNQYSNFNRMRQLQQQWTQNSMIQSSSQQGPFKRVIKFVTLIVGLVVIGFIVLSPLFHYFMQ